MPSVAHYADYGISNIPPLLPPPLFLCSHGNVVIVSSATARWPMPSVAHYGASKAAMDSFFRAVDWEWKLKGVDASITLCVLGLIKTKR